MKNEYKKILISLRNDYIDLSKKRENELDMLYEKSVSDQIDYLNKITFNLISSNNIVKYNIGNFIAYRLFKKKTYKNLLYISLSSLIEVQKTLKSINYYNSENEKIMNTLDFINSVSENELNKYLKYKNV